MRLLKKQIHVYSFFKECDTVILVLFDRVQEQYKSQKQEKHLKYQKTIK